MCTVIYYSFGCGHYVTRCQSRCGGTKVKERRGSRRAACTAEGYVTIKRSSCCSKCSREAWVSRWQARLEKARCFHNELVKGELPGAPAVFKLIEQLEMEYELKAWELDRTVPHGDKVKIRRVSPAKVGWSKLPSSPLEREVQPEEVVLPGTTEPVYDGDDDDWVRSTDPLHPIDTNYELRYAGIDDDYLKLLLGEEPVEVAEPDQDNPDILATSWEWNDGVQDPADGDMEQLPACGQTTEDATSSSGIGIHGLRTQEDTQRDHIQEVIKAFWDVVNIADDGELPSSTTAFTQSTSTNTAASDDAHVTGPRHLWVDSPEPTPQTQNTMPLRGRFRTREPTVEYYAQQLVECRFKLRETVGQGAWVPDPARLKA
ncbi:hypothetical protein PMIN01_05339 [Paraphaeosphaeria minitans]|uniref:Uncharacterized protein n=1 Tax=Paraphaeosphaeria minitans TaxID=565426 RepID=A0A9P6KSS9_9PLEO|nr:hypothetical protein PMIN01_05339 [Paraphaeosphaeria minitans]